MEKNPPGVYFWSFHCPYEIPPGNPSFMLRVVLRESIGGGNLLQTQKHVEKLNNEANVMWRLNQRVDELTPNCSIYNIAYA